MNKFEAIAGSYFTKEAATGVLYEAHPTADGWLVTSVSDTVSVELYPDLASAIAAVPALAGLNEFAWE